MVKRPAIKELCASAESITIGPGQPLLLPETIKAALGLEKGGTCVIIPLDGVVLLVSRPLVSPSALEGMRQALTEAGVTLEDLLKGLVEVRSQISTERYGPSTSS